MKAEREKDEEEGERNRENWNEVFKVKVHFRYH
jgi:hypothetical protein